MTKVKTISYLCQSGEAETPEGEATKARLSFGELEKRIFCGSGLDIGCGDDPLFPDVRRFDKQDGDANNITKYINEQFDYVFSSHCLEHMLDPLQALTEWWGVVKPGGYLYILVPDEDMYEKGIWPSKHNSDHKWTFTIHKHKSWSPVSINILDLIRELPSCEPVSLGLVALGDYSLKMVLRKSKQEIDNAKFCPADRLLSTREPYLIATQLFAVHVV